ncbi:hypothetical protein COJ46_22205 [Bacillus sp. AFS077874]|uniref:hypothetical protein n=1 Tax=Bacillus sp. AFS077874 TaxID=2033513 RepID=UPI000BF2DBED|nr:hypothetical protein [Bacillus sp. AFS077874]PFM75265.1 hypothetical protein COJ46_22205 [Bacillus sp. AFS077874]
MSLNEKTVNLSLVEKNNPVTSTPAIFDESQIMMKKKQKEDKPIIKKSIADIIPVIDLTANGFIELRNGEFMEILQLTTKDVYSLNEEDKNLNIYSFAFFLQSYLEDMKIVPLNFPVDTTIQQQHIQRKLERTDNQLYVPFLKKKLEELRFIEKNRTNREYYLFLYSESEFTLKNKAIQVERLLQRTTPISLLSEEKKIAILYKLNNLNSKTK